ncbi:MAG TPA: DUF2252 family protein [Stellaceae bacterium]|jgi:hypothetical protein|nr:DUF2252 family protein [Stellaceae bacterium]
MNIVAATKDYESWARRRIGLIDADIALKHRRMREAAFPFLRATFYRWCPLYREVCRDLADAPKLLAVGDLHLENFGTWRDAEGRLIWGINDFDEAAPMPYTIDLVRLATSALLAKRDAALSIGGRDAVAAILAGYRRTILAGDGKPFVLEEEHRALRAMATGEERSPPRFWAKLTGFRTVTPPRPVRAMIARRLPEESQQARYVHRIAGLGSLGHARYVGIADSDGGLVAREAKTMLPSAYGARGESSKTYYAAIIKRAVRAPDPFVAIERGWLLRRLAPLCTRIELADLPKRKDERVLLEAMGAETANIHLGSPSALPALRRDLKRRGDDWLRDAARRMAKATVEDWNAWRAS